MRCPCGLATTGAVILALVTQGCQAPHGPGPPARLAVGPGDASDTVVINSHGPTSLRVRALDAAGRHIATAAIHYERASGPELPLSAHGAVTCARATDVVVRASFAQLARRIHVRCRPIEHLQIPGPVDFVLGDSALGRPRPLPLEAYAANGSPVTVLAGTASVGDPAVASITGLTISPHGPGATLASAQVGDRVARIGVHIYQRVETLGALDTVVRIRPEWRLVAVPLRLPPGSTLRQSLPPGGWMLSMLPENEREALGVRLRVQGARCEPVLAPRRYMCSAGRSATVIVYRGFDEDTRPATGDLLVRWVGGQ